MFAVLQIPTTVPSMCMVQDHFSHKVKFLQKLLLRFNCKQHHEAEVQSTKSLKQVTWLQHPGEEQNEEDRAARLNRCYSWKRSCLKSEAER